MPVIPSSSAHPSHDHVLIARLADDDLTQAEQVRAQEFLTTCPDCAELLADLRAISRATATMPAPARTHDFRLTDADAVRLRPMGWRGWARRLTSPQFDFLRPVGSLVAVLGLAGILLSAGPGLLPGRSPTSVSAPESGQSQVSDGTTGVAGAAGAAGVAAPNAGQAAPFAATAAPAAAPPTAGPTELQTAGPSIAAASAAPSGAAPVFAPVAPSAAPIASAAPFASAQSASAAPSAPGANVVVPPPVPAPGSTGGSETGPNPRVKSTTAPTPGGEIGLNPVTSGPPPPQPAPTAAPTNSSAPIAVAPLPPETAGPAPVSDATLSATGGGSGGPSIGLILSLILLVLGGGLIAMSPIARRFAR